MNVILFLTRLLIVRLISRGGVKEKRTKRRLKAYMMENQKFSNDYRIISRIIASNCILLIYICSSYADTYIHVLYNAQFS